ncbi:MAG: CvpA family protein [Lachnospiraceae bacterium]|nr:CvpA family protein [Lachnospiraceae bacterium]
MDSNWFLVNVPFLVLVLFLVIKIIVGFKRGAVKELCSFVSAIIAAVVVLLIGFAIRKYIDQDRVIFIVTLLLLFLMITIYRILSLFFTTLKIIAKLPGVSAVNKLLSVPVVICEVIIVTWTVYCVVMVFDQGAFAKCIFDCVQANPIMKFLYEYNYMYAIVARFSHTLAAIDIWKYIGM